MDYENLLSKIESYRKNFNYNVNTLGTTYFNRKIIAVEKIIDRNFKTAILLGSIHARENITSDLICRMIEENLFEKITKFNVSFIIMLNPDGVELSNFGINSCPMGERENLLRLNNQSSDFSLWKANGRGVDINNNFDADFKKFIASKYFSSSGYPGESVESELETKAVVNYTKNVNPFVTISYHSKGEEIYYNYYQTGSRLERDRLIAERFSDSTGYLIRNLESLSCGGYKDYCVKKLKIPALTIEVGSDELSHPISSKYLDEIFEKHKSIANDLIFAYETYLSFEGFCN